MYYLNWNNYYIYLINKKNINLIFPLTPNDSYQDNLNKLQNLWYIYFDNFLYKKYKTNINWNKIIVNWIVKLWNKLYFVTLSWKWGYLAIKNNDELLKYINNIKKWSILINNWNWFVSAWASWIKYYYLWTYDLYKNINIKDLWNILNSTFYIIWKNNLDYNVFYMYNLLKFARSFNNKKLSDLYY